MKLASQQRGMTGIGWLLMIAVIIFVVLIAIKILPVYIDHFNVSSVLSSLENEPGISTMTGGEVTNMLMKRLDINIVKDVTRDDIYISQQNQVRLIEIEYQVQRKLVGNIDVLIHFNDKIEVPIR